MFLKYGNHTHDAGECTLSSIEWRALITENLQVYGTVERWTIDGRLQIADQGSPAANQAAMTVAINTLKTAYGTNRRDIGFYDDAGNLTAHSIQSSSATGGVQIVGFSFPEGSGAEYSTFRTYQIIVEAQFGYQIPGGQKLTAWSETVTLMGGGPKVVFLACLTGPPQKQLAHQATTRKATQSGRATAIGRYSTPPSPLWPADELIDVREITYELPPDSTNQRTTTWNYQFEGIALNPAFPTYRSVF